MGFFNKPKIVKYTGVISRIGVYWSGEFINYYACKLKGLEHDIIKFSASDTKMIVDLALTKENDEIEMLMEEDNPKKVPLLIEFKNFSL